VTRESRLSPASAAADAHGTTFRTSRRGILVRAEIHLREAGRACELFVDPEIQRIGLIAFRLAQRIAVGSGRLERAA